MAETEGASPPVRMPLFYRNPEPLSATVHGKMRIVPGNCAFAAKTNSVPIMTTEFAEAAAHFPIVFGEADPFPIAVLGLEQANLFVGAEGAWEPRAYVPAYIRRYPFVFMETADDRLMLAVDRDSDRLAEGGEGGEALYVDDKPTVFTRHALDFCQSFMLAHRATRAFGAALEAQKLLVPQQADIRLPGGQPLSLAGWRCVDREQFAALDDKTAIDWHRNGWAGLVHLHLASLNRFQGLLARRIGEMDATSAPEASPERQDAETVGA